MKVLEIPEISVIIPAYNTEAYIAQAIESVLQQTITNLEVIIVDDASTDATLEVIKSFVDQRLKILINQENLGAGATRNRALRVAQGKWIAILDSDDWFAPQRLEKLLKVGYEKKADMIADDLYYIKDQEKLPWSTLISNSSEKINKITEIDIIYFIQIDIPGRWGLTIGLTKPIIKRDFLLEHSIEYDEQIKFGQDFWFYLNCLGHNARFFMLPEAYYFYRSRPGSLVTKSPVKRFNEYCNASLNFLQQDFVKNNPSLFDALSKRLDLLEKSRGYFIVLDTLQHGTILQTFQQIIQNPYFLLHLFQNLPRILLRRIKFYFFPTFLRRLFFK